MKMPQSTEVIFNKAYSCSYHPISVLGQVQSLQSATNLVL